MKTALSRSAKQALQASRTSRLLLGLGALAMVVIGLGLVLLMTQATGNRESYNQAYEWLTLINAVVAGGLLITIVWGALRLLLRLKRGQFGSRLLVKLAGIFALVGVIPGLLIYVVSYQFVSRSIESWFDVKVETALVAGLNLGRSTLDTLSIDLAKQTRVAAVQLSEVSDVSVNLSLEKIREQLGVSDAVLWTLSGRMVASAGQSRFQMRPDRPLAQQIKDARQKGSTEWVEGLDEAIAGGEKGRIKILVLLPQTGLAFDEERRLLQITQELPPALVKNALEVQAAYREYQERALARDGLRRMYIGTLTLSLFLAVLGAILLAVVLGNQLARPLLLLAHGMRQVASGDLTPKLAMQGKDELGGLTRSFADMTQQLSVRVPVAVYQGLPLRSLPDLQGFAQSVADQFAMLRSEKDGHDLDHWQKSFEIHALGQGLAATAVTLLARGAVLPDGMRLLVFDDISEIVSAERAQAWGEVARRLAHEIKNPLTPIQLSAERLQRKLIGKLDAQDDIVLNKSVKTIVDQVDAMKRLVNEFRDYARLPSADLKPVQLNVLIADLMGLYANEPSDLSTRARVITDLDLECPAILGDEQQLRQVIHNLLQNAQDACETKGEVAENAQVSLRTEWNSTRNRVRLIVADTGSGFEPNILKRAFEPYVTTKVKGTGLGLAVVKKIADEHGARIELSNVLQEGEIKGAQVSLSFMLNTTMGKLNQPAN